MPNTELAYTQDIESMDQVFALEPAENKYEVHYVGHSRLIDAWWIAGLIRFFSRKGGQMHTDLLVNTGDYEAGEYSNIPGSVQPESEEQ